MNSVPNQPHAIICPSCRKLVSADEPRCPYCGMLRPGGRAAQNPIARGMRDGNLTIKVIIGVNIALYVFSLLLQPHSLGMSMNPLFALAPDSKSLLALGATGTAPIDELVRTFDYPYRWWTLLSANYLHGSLMHIAFNMLAFYQLAVFVNREFGVNRMFIIYTIGGVIGFLASYLAGVRLTIGASAAICALMGAALYFGKRRGGVYGQMVYRQIRGWAVFLLIFGFVVPGINNWGHGAGLLAGAALAHVLGFEEMRREQPWHRWLSGLCIGITALTLVYGVGSAVYYLWL